MSRKRKYEDTVGTRQCPSCGFMEFYSDRFDAYYCRHENVWLGPKCEDRSCSYCRERPEGPVDDGGGELEGSD